MTPEMNELIQSATVAPAPKYTPFASNTHKVTKGRYITSNDPRGFIPVYEYPLNGQWIMMDTDDGYILWTGIWKALGNSKADIVKMIDSQPELASVIRRVRGGYLKIQGTWMPYEHAIRLARRVAWDIRHDLIPLFGPTFPDTCLSPDQPGYGQVVVGSGKRRRRTVASSSSLPSLNDLADASVAASSSQQNRTASPTRTYALQSEPFHPLPATDLAPGIHSMGHPHGSSGRVPFSQPRYSPSASLRDSRYAPYPERHAVPEQYQRYHQLVAHESTSVDSLTSLELPPIHALAEVRPIEATRRVLPPMNAPDQDSQPSRAEGLTALRRLAASEDDCSSEPGRPSSSHIFGPTHRRSSSGPPASGSSYPYWTAATPDYVPGYPSRHHSRREAYSSDSNRQYDNRCSFSPFSDDARSTCPASPITPATPPPTTTTAQPLQEVASSPRAYGKSLYTTEPSPRVAPEHNPMNYSTYAYP